MSSGRILAPLFMIAGLSLSACSKERESDDLVLETRADAGRQEDKFGEGFGDAFRADPNSEPVNVSDKDVEPVSFTTEPEPID